MPNGRSGGFKVRSLELENLLGGFDDDVEVGRSLAAVRTARSMGATPVNLTVAGALAILREFERSEVWIEEQDYSYYVIHFESDVEVPDSEKWIIVDSRSPLFAPLRQRHRR